jgi:hypothetical protein
MKKIILIAAAIITSVSFYMNAEINTKCGVCNQGYLQKVKPNVIFEVTEKGLEPRFDSNILKCDHCQSFTQTKEYNGYFSIPSPK